MTTKQTKSADSAPSTPPATASKRFAMKRPWLMALLLLALFFVAVIYLPVVRSWIPGIDLILGDEETTDTSVEEELAAFDSALSSFAQRLETQEQRFSNLAEEVLNHGTAVADFEARLVALEERAGVAAPTFGAAPGNLTGRLEMLAARVSQLESAFVPLQEKAQSAVDAVDALHDELGAQDRMSAAIAGLEDRLSGLERSASADRRGAIIAIAFSALREAANRGRPFSVEYETLHGLMSEGNGEDLGGELRAVAPYAASGAPTLAMLRASFADSIPAILVASHTPADASWWQRFKARLFTIVTVRPTGEISGLEAEAVLARIERRLASNDLQGALREFATLPPAAQAAVDAWASDARKRDALDQALASFAASLLRAAAAGGMPAAAQKG